MNTYYIAYKANTEDVREALLFEAECKYALVQNFDSVMDSSGTLFELSEKDGAIILVEVDPNENDDESGESTLCNECEALAELDEAILDFISTTSPDWDESSANTLLILVHAKKALQEAHS
jgi:hypothetical protein